MSNRFAAFNPEEREILRILLQEHVNAVSEIAVKTESRVSAYLVSVEKLEDELLMVDVESEQRA